MNRKEYETWLFDKPCGGNIIRMQQRGIRNEGHYELVCDKCGVVYKERC